MRLGINGWRLCGPRTGVARYLLNVIRHWTPDATGVFREITIYTPRPLDRRHAPLPSNIRERVVGPNLPPLDRTHTFLADLRLWRDVLGGYFAEVTVTSEGARYRDSAVLRAMTLAAIKVFGWHELAEIWAFDCRRKRAAPSRRYVPWWLEDVRR